MQNKFTGVEKVLFKATFEFAINVEKLSVVEAIEKAMNKIVNKRALGVKLAKKGQVH
jgi:hypothetical protein